MILRNPNSWVHLIVIVVTCNHNNIFLLLLTILILNKHIIFFFPEGYRARRPGSDLQAPLNEETNNYNSSILMNMLL